MLVVWDFRVERQDADGNPLPRVQVEMHRNSISGSIANGDWGDVTETREAQEPSGRGRQPNHFGLSHSGFSGPCPEAAGLRPKSRQVRALDAGE
jgi:hypothetical protein